MLKIEEMIGKIYCADCLEIMKQMPDKCVDLVLTDPPYGKQTHRGCRNNAYGGNPINFSEISQSEYNKIVELCLEKSKAWVIVFSEWRFIAEAEKTLPLVRMGIWSKSIYTPQFTGDRPAQNWEAIAFYHNTGRKKWNGGGTGSVFNYNSDRLGIHPTCKPIKLIEELINKFTNKGDIIFDPFLGSGTTALAAERLGRKWIGCELEPKYCEIAQRRVDAERAQLKLF